MVKQDTLQRIREHVMHCPNCGAATAVSEMLGKHPRGRSCCAVGQEKKKVILNHVAELAFAVTGERLPR